jgi:type III pantothenate kinase
MTNSDVKRRRDGGILLLDIGNTNLKWAWLSDGKLSPLTSAAHRGVDTDQLARSAWEHEKPSAVYVSNVAGERLRGELESWMKAYWGIMPKFLSSPARGLDVENAYEEPAQLGIDRWMTLVAARRQFEGPVCIVDCGTAITVDVLDGQGHHLGGVILPGFELMRESLLDRTRIPRVSQFVEADHLLGRNTAEGVTAASFHSAAALVERIVRRVGQKLVDELSVVLTGSDATALSKYLDIDSCIEPDLVMKGLYLTALEGAKL